MIILLLAVQSPFFLVKSPASPGTSRGDLRRGPFVGWNPVFQGTLVLIHFAYVHARWYIYMCIYMVYIYIWDIYIYVWSLCIYGIYIYICKYTANARALPRTATTPGNASSSSSSSSSAAAASPSSTSSSSSYRCWSSQSNVKFNRGGILIFPSTFFWSSQLNVMFNGVGVLIFPNTFVDLPNGM